MTFVTFQGAWQAEGRQPWSRRAPTGSDQSYADRRPRGALSIRTTYQRNESAQHTLHLSFHDLALPSWRYCPLTSATPEPAPGILECLDLVWFKSMRARMVFKKNETKKQNWIAPYFSPGSAQVTWLIIVWSSPQIGQMQTNTKVYIEMCGTNEQTQRYLQQI